MENLSDEELVKASLLYSGRVLHPYEQLVKRYESLVNKLCLRYFRNPQLAEEVTQDSFLKAYNHLNKLENPVQFKSWVLRIASNQCTDRYRKIKRREEIQKEMELELESEESPVSAEPEKAELLREAIERLDGNEKDIILMHYFSELSVKEVSEALSIGESAVKMRLSRIRKKIMKNMKIKSD